MTRQTHFDKMHKGTHAILETILNAEKIKGAIFTIKSTSKDKDFTYKIKTSTFNDKKYIHVYYEYQYMKFKYLGFYSAGKIIKKGGVEVQTPVAKAISWSLNKTEKQEFVKLNEQVEIMHIGKCAKCSRPLTDAHSIEIGVGPVCRSF